MKTESCSRISTYTLSLIEYVGSAETNASCVSMINFIQNGRYSKTNLLGVGYTTIKESKTVSSIYSESC